MAQVPDVPIEAVIEAMFEAVKAKGEINFRDLVPDRTNPYKTVSHFLATLELAKQQKVTLEQTEDFADIRITLKPEAPPPPPAP